MPNDEQPQYKVSLDDYLKGRPLSAEHAEMMLESEAEQQPVYVAQDEPKRTKFSEDERHYLNKLRNEPGWEVLKRVLDNAILRQQDSAIVLSQNDPLRNKDEIALQWGYLTCLRWAARQIEYEVDLELRQLKGESEL